MKRACVIGWPVEHSRSPEIHRYWLRRYALDGAYEKEAVAPEQLHDFLGTLAERGYVGANVTLPHKEAALRLADLADAPARAIGAVNTLWLDAEGRLNAGNTDAEGFVTALESSAPDWNGERRPVTVLGAGGAARAIVYGLREKGASEIRLSNRSEDRAERLAQDFRGAVDVIAWKDRGEALAGCGLLVNATSLGMSEKPALDLDLRLLPRNATVADIVYTPRETALLIEARARGNRTVDGLGMLLHQAVPGFERWFGIRPEVTADLRALVAATLPEA